MKEKISKNSNHLKQSGIRYFHDLGMKYDDCIDFSLGEPTFDVSDEIKEKTKEALDLNQTHYAPNQGLEALRNSIVNFENKQKALQYTNEEIIITQGASEAISCALFTILNSEDEVLIPLPAYSGYENAIALARGKCIYFDCENYQISEEILRTQITEKSKAIILTTPNNPTGLIYNSESLRIVAKIASEFQLFVILDLVYDQLSDEQQDLHEFLEIKHQCLLIHSFSKSYAMTGFRLGYLMVDKQIIISFLKVHQSILSCVNTFVQSGALAAFDTDNSFYKQIKVKRSSILTELRKAKIAYVEPNSAFYLYLPISQYGLDSRQFTLKLIEEEHVVCVPGIIFYDDTCVRLSYCLHDEQLLEGTRRLIRFINKLKESSLLR